MLKRLFKNLMVSDWKVRRAFPKVALSHIEEAIKHSETDHLGEIRFVVEAAISPWAVIKGQSARERALEVFSQLRLWDTELNTGVLIYLLLADHDVEIIADRGINSRVAPEEWHGICSTMEDHFKQQYFAEGVIKGIKAITYLLKRHFPITGKENINEFSDRPIVL